METIKTALDWITKLEGLPTGALTILVCIALGYALKFTPSFLNSRIPLVVWLAGGLFYCLSAPTGPSNPLIVQEAAPFSVRVRMFGIGVVLGIMAWLIHNQLLKRIEDSDLLAKWMPPLSQLLLQAKTSPPANVATPAPITPPLTAPGEAPKSTP